MRTIKFNHAQGGGLSIPYTSTGINTLFAMGAITHTAKITANEKAIYNEYATDEKGLKDLIFFASETLEVLNKSIGTIGNLLINSDKKEVAEDIQNIGLLLTALSDLAIDVACMQSNFSQSLEIRKQTKKQA